MVFSLFAEIVDSEPIVLSADVSFVPACLIKFSPTGSFLTKSKNIFLLKMLGLYFLGQYCLHLTF